MENQYVEGLRTLIVFSLRHLAVLLGCLIWVVSVPGSSGQEPAAPLPEAPAPQTPASLPAASTTVDVTASPEEIAEAQMHVEEQQRMLGVFPNFYISYLPDPAPLTAKQKFHLAYRTLVDPVSLALTGVTAEAQQSAHVYAWGQGGTAYAKRYAASYGTLMTSTLIGSALLPSLLHQDPRYFYKGTGNVFSRSVYAIASSVLCKGDNHRWQPNVSAIGGGLAAAGISNLYYPASDRSNARQIFIGAGVGTGFTAVTNLIQEFASRKLTPHVPPTESVIRESGNNSAGNSDDSMR